HEKGVRSDVVHAIVGRDFFPHGVVFPGTAQLGVVVSNVLVMAVAAGHQRNAGARDGSFEARGLGDDEVGGHASVGPAAHTELVGVAKAWSNGVTDHSHNARKILVARVGKNGFAEFAA